jgi:hypothetical protein
VEKAEDIGLEGYRAKEWNIFTNRLQMNHIHLKDVSVWSWNPFGEYTANVGFRQCF